MDQQFIKSTLEDLEADISFMKERLGAGADSVELLRILGLIEFSAFCIAKDLEGEDDDNEKANRA